MRVLFKIKRHEYKKVSVQGSMLSENCGKLSFGDNKNPRSQIE
jgi:hypothetical protein